MVVGSYTCVRACSAVHARACACTGYAPAPRLQMPVTASSPPRRKHRACAATGSATSVRGKLATKCSLQRPAPSTLDRSAQSEASNKSTARAPGEHTATSRPHVASRLWRVKDSEEGSKEPVPL